MTHQTDPSLDGSYEVPAIFSEDAILFPEMEVSIRVNGPANVAATTQALREHSLVVMVPSAGSEGVAGSIGTLVLVRKMSPPVGDGAEVQARGLWRVVVQKVVEEKPCARVRFSRAAEPDDSSADRSGIGLVFVQVDQFVTLLPGVPPEIISFLKTIDTPGRLADMCAYSPFFSYQEKLDLLKTLDPQERLAKVSKLFEKQLSELKGLAKRTTIPDCETCIELADKAFELGPERGLDVAQEFLAHVTREHADELLALLAEKYGPIFLRRRALK